MFFQCVRMPELDYVKERISHYKLWLGILVITDIGLIGWFANNLFSAPRWIVIGCLLTIYVITGCIVFLENRIESSIEKLRYM